MDEPIRARAPSDPPSTDAGEAFAGYLDELERLCNAASPGPWMLDAHGDGLTAANGDPIAETWSGTRRLHDARFIKAARHALPKLIATVRELQAELELVHQRVQFETTKDDGERRALQRELAKLKGSEPSFGLEVEPLCKVCGAWERADQHHRTYLADHHTFVPGGEHG
jgi:hypothetical protein